MYTNQSRVEAYLDRELSDNEALQVDDTIALISSYINSYTNRSWSSLDDEEEPTSEERLFDGNGHKSLNIGDFQSITKIELLDSEGNVYQTLEEATDWILTPANKTSKEDIRLRSFHFPSGVSNVQITGIFGGSTVPSSIVNVATALVAKHLGKQSSSGGQFKSESIEGYSYTLKDSREADQDIAGLMSMLDMHKRILL